LAFGGKVHPQFSEVLNATVMWLDRHLKSGTDK
jgi:hypothetical protein